MSKTLTVECPPAASPVLIAPRFARSGLPQDAHEVKTNLDRQQVDEKRFWNQAIQTAASCGQEATEPCTKTLHISLFFDGTNNHEPSDKDADPRCTSNIARLYHATIDHGIKEAAKSGYYRYYIPGVGTVFKEIHEHVPLADGLKGAEGGESRINWGLVRLIDALKLTLTPEEPLSDEDAYRLVDKMSTCWYGHVFSGTLLERGDAKRRDTLTPELEQLALLLEQRRQTQQKPEILALRLYVYGFSRGAAEARTFANWLADLTRCSTEEGEQYRLASLPISIEFLGLFDTVAAVGIADSAPFAAGHMDWADGTMRLPDESATQNCMPTTLVEDRRFLKRCVHLVSAHEQRASFPLDSIRRRARMADGSLEEKSTYRAGTVEYVYPGMHSDVGGGYPPGDQGKAMGGQGELMSQLPLNHMYREAFAAGAPLQVPIEMAKDLAEWRSMHTDTHDAFKLSPTLTVRFNAWQSQAQNKSGPLEDVVKHETALITGWRIDRYAGGVGKTSFYGAIQTGDEPQEVWDAKRRLHAHKHAEMARKREGIVEVSCADRIAAGTAVGAGDCQGYSAGESWEVSSPGKRFCFEEDFKLVGPDKYEGLNTNKAYEPPLDRRQLRRAADEFRRDYEKSWEMGEDTLSFGGILNIALGGLVYLINEEDEAKEYDEIWEQGTLEYRKLFTQGNQIAPGQEDLVKLFDDHVHDSRAWFMNSSFVAEREPFTDYFRHRLVHFDDQSNKRLSLLAKTGRVVGVGIALASIGLTIKRRDPRYLLGLSLPSLAIPVLRGKVDFPEISAFDPQTGLALPMQAGLEAVRTFSKDTGSLNRLVDSLPAPIELTEQTATTPELKKIFQAAQAAKAVAEAKEGNPMGLVDMLAEQVNEAEQPDKSQSPDWLDMAGDMLGKKMGVS
ncbi:DUF2235 domain-containing protein [Pseudomonas sp. L-22-4S-12]|uniref:T6SS phospholipase effector Tle1-like catalytic domain-containing protein n=1 Tax=Pseudomonas sp. L-22-4S-12 TaxID=2610893 RepID=UPI001326226E|nr:DUF2235 domain-containing protein [Pseudomonas sp. L-22-4S-12]MWV14825.1 DUF2235 domain-containing protein [Pseudomonas sp. L-22-4S-12]